MTRLFVCLFIATLALAEQSLRQMFERARMLEEKNQNLSEAIQLYGQVVNQAKDQRALAARAQLQIGLLHERLGHKAEAQRAFQAVLSEFADQIEVVRQAQPRISTSLPNGKRDSVSTRRIWAGADVDLLGGPSPDGRYLTVVHWETGDLGVHDFTTGKVRLLTNKGKETLDFAQGSRVSPDGKQVAYAWVEDRNDGKVYSLRLIGMDGANPRILYRDPQAVESLAPQEWSPDGSRILATFRRADQTKQIVLLSVSDGGVRVLQSLGRRSPSKACFSPDGRYVVYDAPPREGAEQNDIFVLSLETGQAAPLVEHPANERLLGWVPDGKRILFLSDRSGTRDAWLIQVVEGKPQGTPVLVSAGLERLEPIGFARNGTYFFGVENAINDLYVATVDLAVGKIVSPPAPLIQRFVSPYSHPAWSPDGCYLAYHKGVGDSNRTISIRTLETGKDRDFPKRLTRMFKEFQWSPDGRSLLMAGEMGRGRNGIFKMDVQTGDVTAVRPSEPLRFLYDPQASPDGKTIFYAGNHARTENNQTTWRFSLLTLDLQGGKERELYEGQVGYVLSPDGRHLALADREALKLMPASGGEPRELLRLQGPESIAEMAWTPDGRDLLFVKANPSNQEQSPELWQVRVASGEARKVGPLMKGLNGLSIHPDGRRIAFTAGEQRGDEVWVMENFLPVAGRRE
jgi:Tol biopolymer transport system component